LKSEVRVAPLKKSTFSGFHVKLANSSVSAALYELSVETAAMCKYWLTDEQNQVIDECLQLHGGYGFMQEYAIAEMWTDARVQRIYGGTNEIMKELISRSL
jgi:alkylation response protein AidB-like acyl-CoA dehydrogenase